MKRDDFNVRIDQVRELATKYSKPELQRMVQMGVVGPQEAVMAGMMIDRIAKSAMTPPQSTVAQDVLGMAPTAAQGQMPQMPQGQMPPQMPPQMAADGGIMGMLPQNSGVAALPSYLPDYAGGGIVAFADGGDIPSFAGDKGSFIDPEFRTKDPKKIKEAQFNILAQELRDQQEAARTSEGEDKLRALSNIQAIQREMRSIKPAPSADAGISALIPSAQAATPMVAKAPAPTAPTEEEASYDPMTGLKISGPEPKPYTPELKPGTVYEPNLIRDILQGGPGKARPEAAKPAAPPVAIPPSKFEVKEAPAIPPPAAPTEPELQRPQNVEAQKMAVPPEKSAKQEYAEVQDMYKEAGVDPNIYAERMKELEGKKAGLAQRKEQALGAALMAFGLGLSGARQGQVFQTLSNEGQKALGMYMNNMDRINENSEKIDALKNQARMEENNFKRTGAENALTRRDRALARADNIMAKNAEFAQDAAKANANLFADLYKTDVYFKAQSQNAAARLAAALGSNKGGYTEDQLGKLYAQVEMENRPRLLELYKDKGNKEAIEQAIKDEITNLAVERVNQVRGLRQKGNIAVPSSGGGQWNVQGGVD
jgi:hypothetical protein